MGITIHQALHGYSEGHRQLACSTVLSSKDARLVLVMSDVSGSGVVGEGMPYLTGYPLQESGFYAIAKTWPAPEMPRPGCVWTHTLLVEFSELAALECPSSLSELFRNPSIGNPSSFGTPIHGVRSARPEQSLSPIDSDWVWRMAGALYGQPQEQIWARRQPGADLEQAVLCLWDQQWPRLRRSFKFCTLTTTDRSQEGLLFDLQLCPVTASPRLRLAGHSDGWEALDLIDARWLQILVADASQSDVNWHLRRVLRLLGADVLGGREAMKPICELLVLLGEHGSSSIDDAIDLVDGSAPLAMSTVAKSLVLREAVTKPDTLDFEAQDFVVRNLSLLSQDELSKYANGIARHICDGDPTRFVELCFDDRDSVREAMRVAAHSISLDTLLPKSVDTADLAAPMIVIRPDLAASVEFWDRTQAWPAAMRSESLDFADTPVLSAMILGLREEGAIASALQEVGAFAVIDGLAKLHAQGIHAPFFNTWLRLACADTDAVALFLSQVHSSSSDIVSAISKHLHPDSLSNDFGDDPWLLALSQIQNEQPGLSVDLLAYGFRRALGWRSRCVTPLLILTFEGMHQAAEMHSIPNVCWEMIEGALPMATLSETRDRGLRLRKAVAKRAIDLRIEATAFVSLTRSEELFEALLDEVWNQWGGRWYLKTVRQKLEESHLSDHFRRLRLIEVCIERRSTWWS